jgi:hypothetical protein
MDGPCTRRDALKIIGATTLGVVPLVAAREASASISWCRTDPWVEINGTHLNIYPERLADEPNHCNGPIRLAFRVPEGSQCAVHDADNGFGHGYRIEFYEDASFRGNSYQVAMLVPASRNDMKVRLVCDPQEHGARTSAKSGWANTWLIVNTKM